MWLKAIRIAEKKFREQRSNVIVATSFGSVVALSMDIPKVPMVRISPDGFSYFFAVLLSHLGLSLGAVPCGFRSIKVRLAIERAGEEELVRLQHFREA